MDGDNIMVRGSQVTTEDSFISSLSCLVYFSNIFTRKKFRDERRFDAHPIPCHHLKYFFPKIH
jgi:hypothetical protein